MEEGFRDGLAKMTKFHDKHGLESSTEWWTLKGAYILEGAD
jgi:hypothetical protein